MARKVRLEDMLPWAAIIAPSVVVTTSGALHTTWYLRGPDVESMVDGALLSRAAQLNHAFLRYGYGWALHWHADRVRATQYATSRWEHAVARLLDDERAALFADAGVHFETVVHLTLIYQTPRDSTQHLWHWLYEHAHDRTQTLYSAVVEGFRDEAEVWDGMLRSLFVDVQRLDNDQTYTYLHGCCSTKRQRLMCPRVPVFLNHRLPDQQVTGGEEPMLDDIHFRILSIRNWPHGELAPAMMSVLDDVPMEFKASIRWLGMDKTQAHRAAHKAQRRWLQKRKGLLAMTREAVTKQESAMREPEAEAFAQDAVDVQNAVAQGLYRQGYLTFHVMVWDQDLAVLSEKVALVQRTLEGEGFSTILEKQHTLEAWWAMMPGNLYDCLQTVPVTTDNLADLAFTTAIWTGQRRNAHLKGNALCYATTGLSTPFGLVLHDGDVGHFAAIGPTGAGKDTLLWFLCLQFLKYPGAQVFAIDKGHGSRVATAAVGGTYEALATDGSYAGQPLARIDEEQERTWAHEWLLNILEDRHVVVTPAVLTAVWDALCLLAAMPRAHRTMTGLCVMLQDVDLREAFSAYTNDGAYGQFFDGDQDIHEMAPWHVLAMDEVLKGSADVLETLVEYRLHCMVRQLQQDRPTMIIVNEFGEFVGFPRMVKKLDSFCTQLRKLNASIGLATQSISRLVDSVIQATGNEIPNRFLLPNFHALEDEAGSYYTRWGLNAREKFMIANAVPKKHYYYTCRLGRRLLDFQFGPIALALCGAGSGRDLAKVEALLAASPKTFAADWLDYKGVHGGSQLLRLAAPEEGEQWESRAVLSLV